MGSSRLFSFGRLLTFVEACCLVMLYRDIFSVFRPDFQQWSFEGILTLLYFLAFNIYFFMVCWCIVQLMITDPGKVPFCWDQGRSYTSLLESTREGNTRRLYCLMCKKFKPERCYHCSVCNRCVLGMDHHNIWVNNCVGSSNRKFFVLLLIYLNCLLLHIIGGLSPRTFHALLSKEQTLDSLFIYARLVVFLLLEIFLFCSLLATFQRVSGNRTAVQLLIHDSDERAQELAKYDEGMAENWRQVFGDSILLWLIPVFGEGYNHTPVPSSTNLPQSHRIDRSR